MVRPLGDAEHGGVSEWLWSGCFTLSQRCMFRHIQSGVEYASCISFFNLSNSLSNDLAENQSGSMSANTTCTLMFPRLLTKYKLFVVSMHGSCYKHDPSVWWAMGHVSNTLWCTCRIIIFVTRSTDVNCHHCLNCYQENTLVIDSTKQEELYIVTKILPAVKFARVHIPFCNLALLQLNRLHVQGGVLWTAHSPQVNPDEGYQPTCELYCWAIR